MPDFSISGANSLPEAAVTPKVEKYSGETKCPEKPVPPGRSYPR